MSSSVTYTPPPSNNPSPIPTRDDNNGEMLAQNKGENAPIVINCPNETQEFKPAVDMNLKEFTKTYGLSDKEAKAAMEQYDTNKDGKLSSDELKKYETARFDSADKDKNTKLSLEELMKTLGLSEKEAKAAMEQFDKNKDGSLSLDEFKKCWKAVSAFNSADTDKNKTLSLDELIAAGHSKEIAAELLNKNKVSSLSFEEYMNYRATKNPKMEVSTMA